jgi:hypothetical protein
MEAFLTRSTTMPFRSLPRSLLLASLVLAPACFAQDIQKCTDSEGRVTLTDQPCDGLAPEVVQLAPQQMPRAVTGRRLGTPLQPRRIVIDEKKAQPSIFLPGDVATLKAARNAMRLLDTSTAPMRSQRIAGYP